MRLSQEAIKAILGIKEPVHVTAKGMAKSLFVTFFPFSESRDREVVAFSNKLKAVLVHLGVKVLSYDEARGNYNKVKKGIAIIATNGKTGNLPVDHIISPRSNSMTTIIKRPPHINEKTSFEEHMNIAVNLFAWHMSDIIICVDKNTWMIYSLNGFSPLFKINKNFKLTVLNHLIPKLAVPVRPPRISEFEIEKWDLDSKGHFYKPHIMDIINASRLFKKKALYPSSRSVETLAFRNDLYKRFGRLYLDKRSGMSYGFFVRQLPTRLSKPASISLKRSEIKNRDFFFYRSKLYIVLTVRKKRFFLPVPQVWVIATRSGCEKTDLDPNRDLIKLGLVNGQMILAVPPHINLSNDYKPSFDTKLILAHAVANAIYGSMLAYFKPKATFSNILKQKGMALAHWHGYMLSKHMPKGWHVYGASNPPVSCSAHQASIYVFRGKERFFMQNISKYKEYLGEMHIEPQHGVNVTCHSLVDLAKFLLKNPKISKLGTLKLQK